MSGVVPAPNLLASAFLQHNAENATLTSLSRLIWRLPSLRAFAAILNVAHPSRQL